jgi:hypothetical protein
VHELAIKIYSGLSCHLSKTERELQWYVLEWLSTNLVNLTKSNRERIRFACERL